MDESEINEKCAHICSKTVLGRYHCCLTSFVNGSITYIKVVFKLTWQRIFYINAFVCAVIDYHEWLPFSDVRKLIQNQIDLDLLALD